MHCFFALAFTALAATGLGLLDPPPTGAASTPAASKAALSAIESFRTRQMLLHNAATSLDKEVPMKRLVLTALVVAGLLVSAAPSSAATPTNKQLARQIKTLQKQVKALQTQVRQAREFALVSVVYSACGLAVTADAFQGTWATIDDVSNRAPPARTIYGPQTPVNDYQTCSAVRITRTPGLVPPNVSVFSAMLAIFR
jgi:outer membrane murein-binding lipoprotein Lpp